MTSSPISSSGGDEARRKSLQMLAVGGGLAVAIGGTAAVLDRGADELSFPGDRDKSDDRTDSQPASRDRARGDEAQSDGGAHTAAATEPAVAEHATAGPVGDTDSNLVYEAPVVKVPDVPNIPEGVLPTPPGPTGTTPPAGPTGPTPPAGPTGTTPQPGPTGTTTPGPTGNEGLEPIRDADGKIIAYRNPTTHEVTDAETKKLLFTEQPNGDTLFPDGMVLHPDGTGVAPDGTKFVVKPNGDIVEEDGTVHHADGTTTEPTPGTAAADDAGGAAATQPGADGATAPNDVTGTQPDTTGTELPVSGGRLESSAPTATRADSVATHDDVAPAPEPEAPQESVAAAPEASPDPAPAADPTPAPAPIADAQDAPEPPPAPEPHYDAEAAAPPPPPPPPPAPEPPVEVQDPAAADPAHDVTQVGHDGL